MREARATSTLHNAYFSFAHSFHLLASFRWNQCIDLKPFIHLLLAWRTQLSKRKSIYKLAFRFLDDSGYLTSPCGVLLIVTHWWNQGTFRCKALLALATAPFVRAGSYTRSWMFSSCSVPATVSQQFCTDHSETLEQGIIVVWLFFLFLMGPIMQFTDSYSTPSMYLMISTSSHCHLFPPITSFHHKNTLGSLTGPSPPRYIS